MKFKKIFYFNFFFSALALFSKLSMALTFSIIPSRDLPHTVPKFGTTSAFYLVTNSSSANLNNNFVKSLPLNVTQDTCQSAYCGLKFNLGPNGSSTDSCLLKLTIKGPVDSGDLLHQLLICTDTESDCDVTSSPLNVTQGPSAPFIGMAAGNYSNTNGNFFPLVVTTNNSGSVWKYPRAVFEDLKISIDPEFFSGLLQAAACSGSVDKSVCIAPGFFCKGMDCFNELPLIAVGRHNANTWTYPSSVFQDLQTRIDPNFTRGSLNGASCTSSGNNAFCVASGVYSTPSMQFPLLALSSNGGGNWTYPTSIFQNLTTSIDPSFSGGFLFSTSCNKSTCNSVCVASGAFCNDSGCNTQLPLMALSIDKGNNWTYPHSVFQDLKNVIDPNFFSGSLMSSSCTGSGNKTICIGVGRYFNNVTALPLLALTTNGGSNWTYPPAIFTDLPSKIGHGLESAFFNSGSCTGSGMSARCIAAGAFTKSNGVQTPLLALTKNSGQDWTYPPFIYTKLKTLVDPDFKVGVFNGTTCIDTGKNSICMAAGNYCTDTFCEKSFPLIAITSDGGKTWRYPPSVFQNLTTKIDPNYLRGFFNDISCTGTGAYSFCIAGGQYTTGTTTFPLSAYSTDNGENWIYPPYIFQNLTTTINPDFNLGFFIKTGSAGGKLTFPNYKKQ